MSIGTRLMLAPCATHLAAEKATAEEKSNNNMVRQPRARFFYNDDGDRPLLTCQGPFQMQHLLDPVDVLLGTGVTTLCYCACCGSDLAYYPSKVCSSPEWRETESHHKHPQWVWERAITKGPFARTNLDETIYSTKGAKYERKSASPFRRKQ